VSAQHLGLRLVDPRTVTIRVFHHLSRLVRHLYLAPVQQSLYRPIAPHHSARLRAVFISQHLSLSHHPHLNQAVPAMSLTLALIIPPLHFAWSQPPTGCKRPFPPRISPSSFVTPAIWHRLPLLSDGASRACCNLSARLCSLPRSSCLRLASVLVVVLSRTFSSRFRLVSFVSLRF